jgi:DNA-binding IclR family transcriptional regulator
MQSQRLKRIFDVLARLAVGGPQTVTEVSHSLSLPVSSTHDLLKAMVQGGMVSSTSDGYDLGPATARLSFKVQDRLNIVNVASPELEKLLDKIGFDTYLAVRTGNDVIYAIRLRGRQRINVDIPLGLPLYRHATAAGKMFAAFNREIRQELMNGPLPRLTPQTRVDRQSLMRELEWIKAQGISISRSACPPQWFHRRSSAYLGSAQHFE